VNAEAMQPDISPILERLSITEPLIGFYDAPDPTPFEPLEVPKGRQCVFRSRPAWKQGKTLHLTKKKHGCGAMHLLGLAERSREELVEFLCDEEGLKASHELMNLWLDAAPHYEPRHEHLLIGPVQPDQYKYLRSVTFYVNPDQLSVLTAGAIYYSHPDDITPLVARFGSGCMQLAPLFDDLEAPQALIGALDQAARADLDPCLLAFTVTKPMFELLSRWAADPGSSLHNRFLGTLLRARGGSLA
jgi:hypothetical protein